ncbi:MAG: alkaline phosphatase [Arenicella sp.]|jgi:alkaline phosphatase
MKNIVLVCALCLVACSPVTLVTKSGQRGSPSETALAKNVILIIGDGMDDHQITIARNYLVGAQGRLTLDKLPHRGVSQILTVTDADPSQVRYVADSANSATAMATGKITSRGRIATTAGTDLDIATIVELAAAAGLKTGLVSTASITDATPASFYAHVSSRGCENPLMMKDALLYGRIKVDCSQDLKANGGLGSISEQLLNSKLDLALGGGLKHFEANAEGSELSVLQFSNVAGFKVMTSVEQLQHAEMNMRWLGLFSSSTMPVRLRGEDARAAEKPILGTNGLEKPQPMSCEQEPKFAAVPDLKLMTERALSRLSHDNDRGFFLMIESASIDKQSHARKACGSIGEVAQLNEALDSALAFAETHPQTLIIVTADHGQAAQLVPELSLFSSFGLPVNTPGKIVRIRTPENALLVVNYATNDFMQAEHTGVNVPVFTNKVGRDLVPAMITQPEIFTIMKNYLRL